MKHYVFVFSLLAFALLGIFVYQYSKEKSDALSVVFCDVGQGDAVYIRTPNGSDILFDAGPDDKVLHCLSRHMPIWDRSIELAILSHPHADHFVGYLSVLKRYDVKSFAMEELQNDTEGYRAFVELLKEKKVAVRKVYAGDTFRIGDGVVLSAMGPTKNVLSAKSPTGMIGDSGEFASLVLRASYGSFDTILTGDSQADGLQSAVDDLDQDVEVLQIPHHGSKSGLTEELVSTLSPQAAVASVGRNKYGHPDKGILEMLRSSGSKIFRTDQLGDVVVMSDGEKWWVK